MKTKERFTKTFVLRVLTPMFLGLFLLIGVNGVTQVQASTVTGTPTTAKVVAANSIAEVNNDNFMRFAVTSSNNVWDSITGAVSNAEKAATNWYATKFSDDERSKGPTKTYADTLKTQLNGGDLPYFGGDNKSDDTVAGATTARYAAMLKTMHDWNLYHTDANTTGLGLDIIFKFVKIVSGIILLTILAFASAINAIFVGLINVLNFFNIFQYFGDMGNHQDFWAAPLINFWKSLDFLGHFGFAVLFVIILFMVVAGVGKASARGSFFARGIGRLFLMTVSITILPLIVGGLITTATSTLLTDKRTSFIQTESNSLANYHIFDTSAWIKDSITRKSTATSQYTLYWPDDMPTSENQTNFGSSPIDLNSENVRVELIKMNYLSQTLNEPMRRVLAWMGSEQMTYQNVMVPVVSGKKTSWTSMNSGDHRLAQFKMVLDANSVSFGSSSNYGGSIKGVSFSKMAFLGNGYIGQLFQFVSWVVELGCIIVLSWIVMWTIAGSIVKAMGKMYAEILITGVTGSLTQFVAVFVTLMVMISTVVVSLLVVSGYMQLSDGLLNSMRSLTSGSGTSLNRSGLGTEIISTFFVLFIDVLSLVLILKLRSAIMQGLQTFFQDLMSKLGLNSNTAAGRAASNALRSGIGDSQSNGFMGAARGVNSAVRDGLGKSVEKGNPSVKSAFQSAKDAKGGGLKGLGAGLKNGAKQFGKNASLRDISNNMAGQLHGALSEYAQNGNGSGATSPAAMTASGKAADALAKLLSPSDNAAMKQAREQSAALSRMEAAQQGLAGSQQALEALRKKRQATADPMVAAGLDQQIAQQEAKRKQALAGVAAAKSAMQQAGLTPEAAMQDVASAKTNAALADRKVNDAKGNLATAEGRLRDLKALNANPEAIAAAKDDVSNAKNSLRDAIQQQQSTQYALKNAQTRQNAADDFTKADAAVDKRGTEAKEALAHYNDLKARGASREELADADQQYQQAKQNLAAAKQDRNEAAARRDAYDPMAVKAEQDKVHAAQGNVSDLQQQHVQMARDGGLTVDEIATTAALARQQQQDLGVKYEQAKSKLDSMKNGAASVSQIKEQANIVQGLRSRQASLQSASDSLNQQYEKAQGEYQQLKANNASPAALARQAANVSSLKQQAQNASTHTASAQQQYEAGQAKLQQMQQQTTKATPAEIEKQQNVVSRLKRDYDNVSGLSSRLADTSEANTQLVRSQSQYQQSRQDADAVSTVLQSIQRGEAPNVTRVNAAQQAATRLATRDRQNVAVQEEHLSRAQSSLASLKSQGASESTIARQAQVVEQAKQSAQIAGEHAAAAQTLATRLNNATSATQVLHGKDATSLGNLADTQVQSATRQRKILTNTLQQQQERVRNLQNGHGTTGQIGRAQRSVKTVQSAIDRLDAVGDQAVKTQGAVLSAQSSGTGVSANHAKNLQGASTQYANAVQDVIMQTRNQYSYENSKLDKLRNSKKATPQAISQQASIVSKLDYRVRSLSSLADDASQQADKVGSLSQKIGTINQDDLVNLQHRMTSRQMADKQDLNAMQQRKSNSHVSYQDVKTVTARAIERIDSAKQTVVDAKTDLQQQQENLAATQTAVRQGKMSSSALTAATQAVGAARDRVSVANAGYQDAIATATSMHNVVNTSSERQSEVDDRLQRATQRLAQHKEHVEDVVASGGMSATTLHHQAVKVDRVKRNIEQKQQVLYQHIQNVSHKTQDIAQREHHDTYRKIQDNYDDMFRQRLAGDPDRRNDYRYRNLDGTQDRGANAKKNK